MRFEKTSVVSHPASLVLETMIERMHKIVPFLPSVSGIDLISREDQDQGQIRIVRKWQGTTDSAPSALRPARVDAPTIKPQTPRPERAASPTR